MARGDFIVFEEFADQLGKEMHNFSSDVIKLAIVTSTAAPAAGDTTPTYSDYSANEVSAGGGYTTTGITVPVTWVDTAGVAKLDDNAGDIALAQNGSGFTNAAYGILYNSTEATGAAIGFIDLGGPVSEVAGPVNINWHTSGILTVTVN